MDNPRLLELAFEFADEQAWHVLEDGYGCQFDHNLRESFIGLPRAFRFNGETAEAAFEYLKLRQLVRYHPTDKSLIYRYPRSLTIDADALNPI